MARCMSWAVWCVMVLKRKKKLCCPKSPRVNCACNRWRSQSPPPAQTPRNSKPWRCVRAITMWSTAKKCGPRDCNILTTCFCWRAPRRWLKSKRNQKACRSSWSICAKRWARPSPSNPFATWSTTRPTKSSLTTCAFRLKTALAKKVWGSNTFSTA